MKITICIFFVIILICILLKKQIYETFNKNLIYFYTFCVDIGRHSRDDLIKSLQLLVKSLNKYVKNYKLIIFKNFDINFNDPNIIFRKYYQGNINIYDNETWKKLSFNKLNIYRDLYIEFNKSFTWLDLDTIILYDISYFNNYNNIFIINGGLSDNGWGLFTNTSKYKVKHKEYIQGNVWKINMNIYNKLLKTLNKDIKPKNLNLQFDLQDLFNYHIYFKDKISSYNLIGKNVKKNVLNGLGVWEDPNLKKPNQGDIQGLKKLYKKDNVFKTKYYPNYDIHIISLTFFTLNKIRNNKEFKHLFDF